MNKHQTNPTDISTLSHDGRGIAHIEGKTTFIENALPGEKVLFQYTQKHSNYDEGKITDIITPSPDRITPVCAHFTLCGGCQLQHMNEKTQLAFKQKIFLEQLQHFGGLKPQQLLPPLTGPQWGYRRKARLGVKFVIKKNSVLVGFREKNGRYLADLNRCEVLHPTVGELIPALKSLIATLAAFMHIPQIEVAVGDEVAVLVFRHLIPLTAHDREKLLTFGRQYNLKIYLQPNKPATLELLDNHFSHKSLNYQLADYGITLTFQPTDFIQVNASMNQKMIKQVLALLNPQPTDRILDLFCGLGNFTLPLAKFSHEVIGVEGDIDLIERAKLNAQSNLIANAHFFHLDLNTEFVHTSWAKQHFDKILLDPPRTGALEAIKQIIQFKATKIVYVSCNPATFARDAGELAKHGYTLEQAGIMDMFPHTQHVETIGLFSLTC